MNKRQRKKKFKRLYGHNPPKGIPIHEAERAAATIKMCKNAWEYIKGNLAEFVEVIQQSIPALQRTQTRAIIAEAKIEDVARQQLEEIKKTSEEEKRWKQFT